MLRPSFLSVRPLHIDLATAIALLLGAVLQYRRSIAIGLLSDDFALYDWAMRAEFTPASWQFSRPFPLTIWYALGTGNLFADSATLHILNIALHGLNAVLLNNIAVTVGFSRLQAFAAAALFVCYPTAVETVVWPSAISDVLMASIVMSAFWAAAVIHRPWAAGVLSVAGLLTKETGIIIGPLLAVAGLALNRTTARLLATAAIAGVLAAAYVAVRVISGAMGAHPGVTWASIQALVTDAVPTLALPFHRDIRSDWPAAVLVWAAVLTTVGIRAAALCGTAKSARAVAVTVLWIIVSAAPAVGLFAVGDDLQGSRYLYLATVGWTLLLGQAFFPRRGGNAATVAACVTALAIAATATWRHQARWADAARMRDVVLSIIADLPADCDRVLVTAAPDNVHGAYVFRNGVTEALRLVHGRRMEVVSDPQRVLPHCRVDFSDLSRAGR